MKRKPLAIIIDLLIVTYIVWFILNTNPQYITYARYYMQVLRWYMRTYYKYMTGPAWVQEAMKVRGSLNIK